MDYGHVYGPFVSVVSIRLSGAEDGSITVQCSVARYLAAIRSAAKVCNPGQPFTFHYMTFACWGMMGRKQPPWRWGRTHTGARIEFPSVSQRWLQVSPTPCLQSTENSEVDNRLITASFNLYQNILYFLEENDILCNILIIQNYIFNKMYMIMINCGLIPVDKSDSRPTK